MNKTISAVKSLILQMRIGYWKGIARHFRLVELSILDEYNFGTTLAEHWAGSRLQKVREQKEEAYAVLAEIDPDWPKT